MYKIIILEKAEEQLSHLPSKEADQIAKKINRLSDNPQLIGSKKLIGYGKVYRIRQGNYRIIYMIENKVLTITVIKIGHRKNIYK